MVQQSSWGYNIFIWSPFGLTWLIVGISLNWEHNSEKGLHPNSGYGEDQKKVQPRSYNWVCQLLGSVAFAYNLSFGFLRYHLKDFIDEYNSEKSLHHAFGYGVP